MHTRLKRLTTLAAVCASFAVAAPAQAAQDSGNGKQQRCAAAVNGNHNGFSCEDVVDDKAGRCARGYELIYEMLSPEQDVNGNQQICVRK